MVVQLAMVQENPTNVTRFSNKTPQLISDLSSSQQPEQGNSRTSQKPKVENLCLESQCETRLNCDGWAKLAITFHILSLAESTKKQYDSTIKEFMSFVI